MCNPEWNAQATYPWSTEGWQRKPMHIRGNSQIQNGVVPLMAGCVPVCGPLSVLQEFERRASASPDALAISCEGRQVTYRELNFTAAGIAGVVKEAGVVAGAMVGVLLDRSPDMIAALFGIWKAGSVYIPLDLAAPPKRLAFMLQDSAPPFVFTRRKFVDRLPAPTELVIDLGDLSSCEAQLKNVRCALPEA